MTSGGIVNLPRRHGGMKAAMKQQKQMILIIVRTKFLTRKTRHSRRTRMNAEKGSSLLGIEVGVSDRREMGDGERAVVDVSDGGVLLCQVWSVCRGIFSEASV